MPRPDQGAQAPGEVDRAAHDRPVGRGTQPGRVPAVAGTESGGSGFTAGTAAPVARGARPVAGTAAAGVYAQPARRPDVAGGQWPHGIERIDCSRAFVPVSYTHLRAHETPEHLVCR